MCTRGCCLEAGLTSLLTHHPGRTTPIEPSPPLGGLEASRSSHRPRKFITGECRTVSDRLANQLCSTRPRARLRHQSQRPGQMANNVVVRMPRLVQRAFTRAIDMRIVCLTVRPFSAVESRSRMLQGFSKLFGFQMTSASPRR